jgi:hypothetical protein
MNITCQSICNRCGVFVVIFQCPVFPSKIASASYSIFVITQFEGSLHSFASGGENPPDFILIPILYPGGTLG